MEFFDPDSEQPPVLPPRRHELVIEVLKFLTPALGLVLFLAGLNGKYPLLSRPWVFDTLVVLGVFVLIWFAKPRLVVWRRRVRERKRDRRFTAENDVRLRELVEQFAVFTFGGDNRSLISVLRSAHSQNMQAVEQIVVGDYIGSWMQCYQEQLTSPVKSSHQLLSRCREFGTIVQEFNTNYVLRAQKHYATGTPLAEHSIAKLEEFREEWAAFLRSVELWAKGISTYLQSLSVTDHPTLWRLAPSMSFERPKSFLRTKPPET